MNEKWSIFKIVVAVTDHDDDSAQSSKRVEKQEPVYFFDCVAFGNFDFWL
jgi:hypothetical protein